VYRGVIKEIWQQQITESLQLYLGQTHVQDFVGKGKNSEMSITEETEDSLACVCAKPKNVDKIREPEKPTSSADGLEDGFEEVQPKSGLNDPGLNCSF
jgi:hypothetical protein